MYSFGIVFIIVVGIGNIGYFITAYYCYQHFDEIAMEKLGTKLIYHEMQKWCQFQHAIVKTDTGLLAVFVATCLCFGINNIFYPIADVLLLIFGVANIFVMKYFNRHEKPKGVVIFLVLRVLLQGYVVFRLIELINNVTGGEKNIEFFTEGYGEKMTITLVALNFVIVIGEVLSSVKCIYNYGKGLREMINKQGQTEQSSMSENMDTEESV